MKNSMYFEKIIKILKALKEDHPDIEVSQHYALATNDHGDFLTDKELYDCLVQHKTALDINTLSIKDISLVIEEGNQLFDGEKYDYGIDPYEEEEY